MEPRKLSRNEKVWLVGGHPSIQTDGNVARQPEDTWTCDHQDRHLTQKVPAAGPVNLFWMHQQMFDSFKPYTGFLYVTGVITFSLLENFPISISLNKGFSRLWPCDLNVSMDFTNGERDHDLDQATSLLFGSSLRRICSPKYVFEPKWICLDTLIINMNSVFFKQLPKYAHKIQVASPLPLSLLQLWMDELTTSQSAPEYRIIYFSVTSWRKPSWH